MERAQEVLFQDLKNDSAMGKEEAEVISDPDSTTNKGDPQSQRQLLLAYQETSQQQGKKKNYCSPTNRRVSSGKTKLLLAYLETSQQLATSKRDSKKKEGKELHMRRRQEWWMSA